MVGGTGHARFRKGLVVAQVGLSVLLLAGAGLFAHSLYNLRTLDPGFRADQQQAYGGAKYGWKNFFDKLEKILDGGVE